MNLSKTVIFKKFIEDKKTMRFGLKRIVFYFNLPYSDLNCSSILLSFSKNIRISPI